MEGRVGYIPKSLERELKDVLGMNPKAQPNMVGQFINSTQMAGIMDAVIHGNNLVKVVAHAQGVSENEAYELIRRLPYFGRADAMARISDTYKKVLEDSPEIRARKADLAERGLLRTHAHYQEAITRFIEGEGLAGKIGEKLPDSVKASLLSGESKMNKMAEWLYGVYTGSRIILDDAFTEMVKKGRLKDTPENRRKYVEQVGQYNDRLMGPIQRSMRNWGIAPFVVAGRTMNRNARRALTGYVGAESSNFDADLRNRMVGYFGTATAALLPVAWNLAHWGNALGPNSNAPIGTMVLSKKDEYGKNKIVNVFADSFIQRGLNLYGGDYLQGVMTGNAGIESEEKSFDKAVAGRIHPWAGPFPQATTKAFGFDVSTRKRYGYSDDTASDRTTRILSEVNPLLMGSLSDDPGRGALEKEARRTGDESTARALKHVDALSSPFIGISGYREGEGQASPAAQMAHQLVVSGFGQMTKETARKERLKTELRAALKKDPEEGMKKLKETPLEDLSIKQKENILKTLNMTRLQKNIHSNKVTLRNSYEILELAKNSKERKEIGAYVIQKLVNKSKTSEEQPLVDEFKKRTSKYKPEEVAAWVEDYKQLTENGKLPSPEE